MNTPIFDSNGVIGIGYEGLDAAAFTEKVQEERVSLLVDVRLNPISRKPGLSKKKLSENLESLDIGYIHAPSLGNPKWNRPGFSGTTSELLDSREKYAEIIASPEATAWIDKIAYEASNRLVGLMCFEASEGRCHRYITIREIRKKISLLSHT